LRSIENKAGTSVISRYTYSVNPITQRESVTTAGSAFGGTQANWNWQYDSLGQHTRRLVGWAEFAEQSPERGDFFMLGKNQQLVRADQPTNSASNRKYEYDTIGNRTKSASGTTALPTANNWTSNALNQYTVARGITLPTSPAPAPYDLDGNMTAGLMPGGLSANSGVQPPANATGITWDAENRLISFTISGVTHSYTYDHLSRAIARLSSNVVNQRYGYDGWNRIVQYDGGATLQDTFTWGLDLSGSMQGAGGVGGLLATRWVVDTINNTDYFPAYDGNGNVTQYLRTNGTIASHYEYDPFGTLTRRTGTPNNRLQYRFSTKPRDTISGLYYYGYRWYDPLIGRWPSRDPIVERGGLNLYGFVGNDGINHLDIFGLLTTDPDHYIIIGGVAINDKLHDKWWAQNFIRSANARLNELITKHKKDNHEFYIYIYLDSYYKRIKDQSKKNGAAHGVHKDETHQYYEQLIANWKAKGVFVEIIKNDQDVVNLISDSWDGTIASIDIFAHTYPGSILIDYGYNWEKGGGPGNYNLTTEEFTKIPQKKFRQDAIIMSWGCKQGAQKDQETGEEGMMYSLSKYYRNVRTKGSTTRTTYENTKVLPTKGGIYQEWLNGRQIINQH
jgi:RHS repeat-associated protein